MIMDIFETKSFAATFTGLTTLGVSYLANVPDWALLVMPLSVVAGYWLIHHREAAAASGPSHYLANARWQKTAASPRVVRINGACEALAREANLLICRAAFDAAKRRHAHQMPSQGQQRLHAPCDADG